MSSYIYVEQADLTQWAVDQKLLSADQAQALWPALAKRAEGRSGLQLPQIAFYLGSLIIIGALTWFITRVWLDSVMLFFLALVYAAVFGAGGAYLWDNGPALYNIPSVVGGLFVAISVAVLPAATFALESYFNVQELYVMPRWLPIPLTAVAAGFVAISRIQFAFLTMPIAVAASLAATGEIEFLLGNSTTPVVEYLIWIAVGIALDGAGFIVDRHTADMPSSTSSTKQDFGFWLYLVGTVGSFFGLTGIFFNTDPWHHYLGPYNVLYIVFSLAYMVAAAQVNRRSMVAVGGIGVVFYLFWLTYDLFWNSWYFPFVLTVAGLLIIAAGVLLQKYFAHGEEQAPTVEQQSLLQLESYEPVVYYDQHGQLVQQPQAVYFVAASPAKRVDV